MTETLIVEIRSGEGGSDAKDLVREQAALYQRYCVLHRL